jgi:hypothetical protein
MAAPKGNCGYVGSRAKSPLERFAEKCAFDPFTGCVMWTGGTTSGHGHNQPYGSFWFGNRRWFAHRWAALHIHGLDIASVQVDHCCPAGPSTLCVQHVQTLTLEENRKLQAERSDHRCAQSDEARKYWIFVQKGLEEYRSPERLPDNVPFHAAPAWLAPFLKTEELEDCPF